MSCSNNENGSRQARGTCLLHLSNTLSYMLFTHWIDDWLFGKYITYANTNRHINIMVAYIFLTSPIFHPFWWAARCSHRSLPCGGWPRTPRTSWRSLRRGPSRDQRPQSPVARTRGLLHGSGGCSPSWEREILSIVNHPYSLVGPLLSTGHL